MEVLMRNFRAKLAVVFSMFLLPLAIGCAERDSADAAQKPVSPVFTEKPRVTRSNGQLLISFSVNVPVDCAVWIENNKGRKIRHLAAGVLGRNAPVPFKAGTLSQKIIWDGKDDRGRKVDMKNLRVRVGLGTRALFDRVIVSTPQWLESIHAMVCDKKGQLYVYSSDGINVLDRQGKYLKQIAPAPSTMPIEKLKGLEPVRLKSGGVYFKRSYQFPGDRVGSMALTPDGHLLLPGPARFARYLTRIALDGSVPAGAFDTKMTMWTDDGFLNMAASPDGKYVYFCSAEAGYRGDDARRVSFRQSVYRLRLDSKGPAEIFTGDDENRGGPGFSVSQPRGLACDAKGNLYVCNQRGGNIAVYNSNAGLIRSIKVANPQRVIVNPADNSLYVLAGLEKGYTKYGFDYPASWKEARLLRFNAQGQQQLELKLPDPFVRTSKSRPGPAYRLSMAGDFSGKRPLIWVGVSYPGRWSSWHLKRIEDLGDSFAEAVEVCPRPKDTLIDRPLHLQLDRQKDLLYVNAWKDILCFDGQGKFIRKIRPVDPTGKRKFYLVEMALGPDGNFYATVSGRWDAKNDWIIKFDHDGKIMPIGDAEPQGIPFRFVMKGAGGHSSRGFTVGPDGNIFVLYYDDKFPGKKKLAPWDRAYKLRVALAKLRSDGTMENPRLIAHLRTGANGIRVDSRGCLYVGDNFMPLGVSYPSEFSKVLPEPLKRKYPARLAGGSFDPLLRNMGCLVKFGPGGGSIAGLASGKAGRGRESRPGNANGDLWKPVPEKQWIMHNSNRLSVKGGLWQYHGMSPIPAQYQGVTHVDRCVCRGGRFDLDEFDRAFVPDTLRKQITVLDSAGNIVLQFGRPGNRDSVGGEGADIGLADPWWLAAASDRVYIGERSARKIIRVRLVPSVSAVVAVE
jgi:hypothetical protein